MIPFCDLNGIVLSISKSVLGGNVIDLTLLIINSIMWGKGSTRPLFVGFFENRKILKKSRLFEKDVILKKT